MALRAQFPPRLLQAGLLVCIARVIVGHEEDVEAAREVDALAAALRASGEWAVSAS
jgi:hypothetical protein